MSKEILTSGDVKIEKHEFYRYICFLEDRYRERVSI